MLFKNIFINFFKLTFKFIKKTLIFYKQEKIYLVNRNSLQFLLFLRCKLLFLVLIKQKHNLIKKFKVPKIHLSKFRLRKVLQKNHVQYQRVIIKINKLPSFLLDEVVEDCYYVLGCLRVICFFEEVFHDFYRLVYYD